MKKVDNQLYMSFVWAISIHKVSLKPDKFSLFIPNVMPFIKIWSHLSSYKTSWHLPPTNLDILKMLNSTTVMCVFGGSSRIMKFKFSSCTPAWYFFRFALSTNITWILFFYWLSSSLCKSFPSGTDPDIHASWVISFGRNGS